MNEIFLLRRGRWVALLCMLIAAQSFAQPSTMEYYKGNTLNRAKNYMSGNLVRTVFYNYGLVGNIPPEVSGEWPIYSGNEYVGDVSPLVGVEFIHPSGDTLVSVTTSDGPRGNPDGPPGGGGFYGFEPLPGFSALPGLDEDALVAMSNQPTTWPDIWPDKYVTDSLSGDKGWARDQTDPGWPGAWNGYFGKNVTNADQESFFLMDDQADLEWFEQLDSLGNTYYYYPHAEDTTRRGLGLRVAVRGLQWAHFLAQDVIFWLYEITNISTHVYDKVAFGMMVGTLSGGRGDSQDDLAYFDLENDITYSWDSDDRGTQGWVPVSETNNVGYVGYAFLESPGNPLDGIDNDGDSRLPNSPRLTGEILGQFLQPRAYGPGQTIVLIDYTTYARTVTTFPQTGPLTYSIREREVVIYPGQQLLEDGGNGIDDNLNGLIDERIDHRDLAYIDYPTGRGANDPLIDEARDDGEDNDQDWNPLTDDLGGDGVALTQDVGEGDGMPTNGEPNFDKTDVDESDQIGLTSFYYFTPPGAVRMRDDEGIWEKMTPGFFDIVEPDPQDGDFVYGSGYFPLKPGQTERFSMALAYGQDLPDITDNKITVQQIYDENYNFARPPNKPTLWAVPGDGKVTLYWDGREAEASLDPICRCYDFEGYKIYRATDPGFNEIFTVTDGMGRKVFHAPLAQFDLDNSFAYVDTSYITHLDSVICDSFFVPDTLLPDTGAWQYLWCFRDTLVRDSNQVSVEGFFPLIRNSVIYYLGDNSGLQHSFVDTTVENGQTYYYAVVAYDRGDINRGILPAENNKTIIIDPAGNVTLDINTVMVTPRAPAAGYEPPQFSTVQHVSGSATGTIAIETVDPREVEDGTDYRYEFDRETDTSQVYYSVYRTGAGTTDTLVNHEALIPQDNLIDQAERFATYYDSLFNLQDGLYDPAQYFRVAGTELYDGQRGYILTPRQTTLITQASGWTDDTTRRHFEYRFGLANYPLYYLTGAAVPGDFAIEWYEDVVDTAKYFNWYELLILPERPVNFRLKNLNSNEYMEFAFQEQAATQNGLVDNGEVIIFFADTIVTWTCEFRSRSQTGQTEPPVAGDVLTLKLYQPYGDNDVFTYDTRGARVNADAVSLERINVYPNPYVAANPQEPTNLGEGRGERRITFNHLPDRCTIRIYTVKGELVETIEHDAGIDDGTENWDLRSKDGLNVAYGIYLYHVDSPYGEKTGRFAVIK